MYLLTGHRAKFAVEQSSSSAILSKEIRAVMSLLVLEIWKSQSKIITFG